MMLPEESKKSQTKKNRVDPNKLRWPLKHEE